MSGRPQSARRGVYNDAVRAAFGCPRHAGDLQPGAGAVVAFAVDEGGAGARIRLAGEVDGGRWRQIRYRVFGCPHLIAAAEHAAERFEGGPVEALRTFPVDEFIEILGVPPEKTGRILLLEDAFLGLYEKQRQALEKSK